MRTFTKLREFSISYEKIVEEIELLKSKANEQEKQTHENTKNIKQILVYLQELLEDAKQTEEKVMGFKP